MRSPSKDAAASKKDQVESDKKDARDDLLVIFTGLLVLVGVLQFATFVVQALLLRKTVRDSDKAITAAQTSADAALLQAKAMIASGRGELVIARGDLLVHQQTQPADADPVLQPGPIAKETEYAISIVNVGPGRSTIREICVEWIVVERTAENANIDPPKAPVYENTIGMHLIVRGDDAHKIVWGGEKNSVIRLTDEQVAKINRNDAWLWVYGYLKWEDYMKEEYIFGFISHWEAVAAGTIGTTTVPVPRGFIGEGPPAYTYSRKLTAEQG